METTVYWLTTDTTRFMIHLWARLMSSSCKSTTIQTMMSMLMESVPIMYKEELTREMLTISTISFQTWLRRSSHTRQSSLVSQVTVYQENQIPFTMDHNQLIHNLWTWFVIDYKKQKTLLRTMTKLIQLMVREMFSWVFGQSTRLLRLVTRWSKQELPQTVQTLYFKFLYWLSF